MKHLLTAFLLLFLFAACHSDDEEITDSGNVNRNDISLYPDAARLEFPKLKTENSVLIVHRTGGEVNYSVEWDYNLKSQRWSCYTLNRQSLEQHTTRYYGNPNIPSTPTCRLNIISTGRRPITPRVTISTVPASTTGTSAPLPTGSIPRKPIIRPSTSPTCSRNIRSSTPDFGQTWRAR